MSETTFSFEVREKTGRLVKSWLYQSDWESIDIAISAVQAAHEGLVVDCTEHEHLEIDDRELHEAAEEQA